MAMLVMVPTEQELDELLQALEDCGHAAEALTDVRLPAHVVPNLEFTMALGGLGKVQFAIHTQYLLSRDEWHLVVCAGAAGALVDAVHVGDVVVGIETVEHDIRKVGTPLLPRFVAHVPTVEQCRITLSQLEACRVHFGAIASGDEDIVDQRRRIDCQEATGAVAVAWEGAGGARACAFSGVPFVEIRGIADRADHHGPRDFRVNLRRAMKNVATVICAVAKGAV